MDRWRRVEELFYRAIELPAGERAAFVRAETADDVELRLELEQLLAGHDETDEGFLAPRGSR